MTALMREKLNLRLGAEVVQEIVLKAGRVVPPVTEKREEPSLPRPLSPSQLAAIAAQSASIPDLETRQAFIELMQASFEQQN